MPRLIREVMTKDIAAARADASSMTLQEVCTASPRTLRPDDDVREAVRLIKDNAVRRVPIISDDGTPVGLISLGDLAQRLDRDSALDTVSAAPPTH